MRIELIAFFIEENISVFHSLYFWKFQMKILFISKFPDRIFYLKGSEILWLLALINSNKVHYSLRAIKSKVIVSPVLDDGHQIPERHIWHCLFKINPVKIKYIRNHIALYGVLSHRSDFHIRQTYIFFRRIHQMRSL